MQPNKLLCIFCVAAALLTGCRPASSDTANAPLSFYIVSAEKVDGGRFIDTPDFPKLGYIAATPDLTITQLEAVKQTVGPMPAIPRINITMHPEDAKKVAALTGQAVGKHVLITLGDTPLIAPQVVGPITGQSFDITLGVNNNTDPKQIISELKTLVR